MKNSQISSFFTQLEVVLQSKDFDAAEQLRESVTPQLAPKLTQIYVELDDWEKKELIIQMVQDQLSQDFSDILLDAINAPSADSKVISICYREQDRNLREKYIVDYFVSPALVEKDLIKYLPPDKWWGLWQ